MIPADTAERLGKLLPRLGSDHDGEAVATVRAIGRTLAAAGLDFHALAATLIPAEPWMSPPRPWPGIDPASPEAPALRPGTALWPGGEPVTWRVAAAHALDLDKRVPAAFGGRSLACREREHLKAVARSGFATNSSAALIEATVARLRTARERWEAAKPEPASQARRAA